MAASPPPHTETNVHATRPTPDAIIVGAGLSGLVAAAELVDAGKRVVIVEQEPAASLGGQAHWSFGGLFLIDSPEQRRMGVKDSLELAKQDWDGTAGFDRDETSGVAAGRTPTSSSPPARSARGCTRRVCASSRRRLGRTRRLQRHRPRQLRAAVPHHVGHRTGRARPVHRARAGRRSRRARRVPASAPRRRARRRVGAVVGVRGAVLEADAAGRGEPATATWSATSSCEPARWSWHRAASAAITVVERRRHEFGTRDARPLRRRCGSARSRRRRASDRSISRRTGSSPRSIASASTRRGCGSGSGPGGCDLSSLRSAPRWPSCASGSRGRTRRRRRDAAPALPPRGRAGRRCAAQLDAPGVRRGRPALGRGGRGRGGGRRPPTTALYVRVRSGRGCVPAAGGRRRSLPAARRHPLRGDGCPARHGRRGRIEPVRRRRGPGALRRRRDLPIVRVLAEKDLASLVAVAVQRRTLVEAHRVDDILDHLRRDGEQRHAPLEVVEAGRAPGDQLHHLAGERRPLRPCSRIIASRGS